MTDSVSAHRGDVFSTDMPVPGTCPFLPPDDDDEDETVIVD